MKLFAIGALACCIGSSLCGADNDTETHGLCNGRFWVSVEQWWLMKDGSVPHVPEASLRGLKLPPAQAGVLLFKMAFVSGVADAAAVSGSEDYYFAVHANDVSIKEIILGLGAFYKVPENLRVPIAWASLGHDGGEPAVTRGQLRKRGEANRPVSKEVCGGFGRHG